MNGTGSKFWIGMILGVIGMLIVLFIVPIIRDLAVGITVQNALNILEREGYVAYSNPEGELITKGVLPKTADTFDLGNVNYEWKNLYLGDAGGIVLGTAQDIYLHRHAADQLGVHSDLNLEGNALLGGTNVQLVERVASGYGIFHIKPVSGDAVGELEIIPSGTQDRTVIHLYNAADIANAGRFIMRLDGTSAFFGAGASGTGSPPTQLQISGMTLKVDKIEEKTAGANVTFASDIDIGANKIKTTNLLFKEYNSTTFALRDAADTAWRSLYLDTAFVMGYMNISGPIDFSSNAEEIRAPNIDDTYLRGMARQTGVGRVEIWRMVGAAQPFMQLSSLGYGVVTKTAAYTAANDAVILCDASAGAFTISLPTASGIKGKAYLIKKIDSSTNAVTIDPYGTETIDGAATVTLASQYDSLIVVSDGINWMKF